MDKYEYAFDFAVTTFCQSKFRTFPITNTDTGEMVDWLTPTHVPLETLKHRFDSIKSILPRSKFLHAQLCGEFGDPIMHPQIDKIVDYLQSSDHVSAIEINTNGGLRQPKWYEKIGEYDKIEIIFGIDGIDHDTNWKYREGVDFKRAWENMLAFKSKSNRINWQFIIFEWNWHQIEEAKQIADDLDIKISFIINRGFHGRLTPELRNRVESILNVLS